MIPKPKPKSRLEPASEQTAVNQPESSGAYASEMPTTVRLREDGDQLLVPEWALVAYAGVALGRIFPLAPGVSLIGRAPDSQVALLDSEVSRQHARLTLAEGRIHLEDLGSTNGTRINGERLDGTAELRVGDRLAIGGHVLKLVALDVLERAFHETLLDLSSRDLLTGLANRGAVLGELQARFGLSERYDRPLSVVVCDLDRFKAVNDSYGHGAGDFVLRTFGERVANTLREADIAGRIGGEEFLMILPETDLTGAIPFAERLRKAVADTPMPLAGEGLAVTCSLGIAQREPGDQDAGQLLARADAALYQAKAEGRNRVCRG